MASKEKQIKNGIVYMVPVAIGNILPLITLPIFTRILSKEDYGIWALAQVYAVFINGIANFGLSVGYERNFFESKEQKKVSGLLYATLLFVSSSFILFGSVTLVLRAQLSKWIIGSPDHAAVLFWSYCATSIMGLKTYYLTYFKNTENAKAYAWYTIDENVLGVVVSLFLVVYLRIGIMGLVLGQLLASATIFLVLSFRFIKTLPFSLDFVALKESFKLSWPLTPRIFFGIIGSQFDKYMIGLLNTVGGVGIYNLGQKLANIVFTFMTAIQNVFSPQVYQRMFDQGEEGRKSIGKYLTPFLYASILIALLISIFSEELITILTPPSYHGAIEIVSILSMLYGTYFFGKQPQLIYAKKTHITSILTLVSIGLNILINIPFIYQWGAIGAAWGTLLAGIISGTISFIVSQHYYKIHWEYWTIIAIFSLFFGSAVLLILLRNFGIPYIYRAFLKFVVLSFYLFLGVRINILTKQNLLLLKQLVVNKIDSK